MNEELNALLGIGVEEEPHTSSLPKNTAIAESPGVSTEAVETELLNQTQDMLDKSNSAVSAVLMEVQSTSGDPDLLQGAAKLITAHAKLLEQLNLVYQTKEKHKQNLELQAAQITAASKMNEDNNTTKVLLSRNEMMSKMLEQQGSTVTVTPEVIKSNL